MRTTKREYANSVFIFTGLLLVGCAVVLENYRVPDLGRPLFIAAMICTLGACKTCPKL